MSSPSYSIFCRRYKQLIFWDNELKTINCSALIDQQILLIPIHHEAFMPEAGDGLPILLQGCNYVAVVNWRMRTQMPSVFFVLWYCSCTVAGFLAKATTSYRSQGRRHFTNMKYSRSSVMVRDAMRVSNSRIRRSALSMATDMSTYGAADIIANSPPVTNQNLYRPMKIMGEKE